MLFKTAQYFLEQALQLEEAKTTLKSDKTKLHCREQLLVAHIMASNWKSKTRQEWQLVIDSINNDHPEYSPLVNSKYAVCYSVAPKGLAVLMNGKTLDSAEDQLIELSKNDKTQVHPVVEMAFKLSRTAVPMAVAVPAPPASSTDNEAAIARLFQEKEELKEQLKKAKNENLNDFREIFKHGGVVGEVGLAAMNSKPKSEETEELKAKANGMVDTLKANIADLQAKNDTLEELSRMGENAKKELVAKTKELTETKVALDAKKTELSDVLALKSEELNDSQEIIFEQKDEIDTLKEKIDALKGLVKKYQVDLSSKEIMFMFTTGKEEDIDVDELWNRTMAYIATKHRSVDEAVAYAVKQYAPPEI